MTHLPYIIEKYFESTNKHDLEKIMTCFDSAGVVQDIGENLEMKGKKEIQEWAKTLVEKYKLSVKPLQVSIESDRVDILAEVSGSFKGSPIQFHYNFKIKNNLIALLTISE